MKRLKYILSIVGVCLFTMIYGQSGPAGVRDNTTNQFWLRGDVGLFESGGLVSIWEDQAASNDASPPTSQEPAFSDPAINGIAGVTFSSGKELTIPNSGSINTATFTNRTIFLVFETPSSFSGTQVLYEQGNATDGLIIYLDASGQLFAGVYNSTNDYFVNSSALSVSTSYIVSFTFDGGSTSIEAHVNNSSIGSNSSVLASVQGNAGDITFGESGDANQISGGSTITSGTAGFTGTLVEAIYYDVTLNDGEVTIINNYLSEKYGIALTITDRYAQAGYENELIGIGRQTAGNVSTTVTGSGGALYFDESGSSLNSDDEWIFAGHNGVGHGTTKSDVDVSLVGFSRWSRLWYVEKTGTVDITISFDTEEAGFGNADDIGTTSDFKLLYSTDPSSVDFTEASGTPAASFTDGNTKVTFTVADADLADGYYTLGVTEIVNFYSYKSGDWDDPLNWTTDPSGSIRVNSDNRYPNQATDNVTILNGDEIDLDADAVTSNGGSYTIGDVTVRAGGFLDLEGTSGHTFENLSGNGTIRLNSFNLPTVNTTNSFITTSGGTYEFYYDGSTDYSINVASTFNDLTINMTNDAETLDGTLTLLSDLTVLGDLLVSDGTFRINDNSSTTTLSLTVNGNVTVDAAGTISTGTGDAQTIWPGGNVVETYQFHQFEIKGDFTNEGTVSFTNLPAANLDQYPMAADPDGFAGGASQYGVVEVLFTSSSQDQMVTCNGPTTFYRIEVDKGTDDTYICEITANNASNFNLFGRVAFAQHVGSNASEYVNPKALGLEKGTLKLSDNIVIPEVTTDDQNGNLARVCSGTCNFDFVIFPDARLWLAGTSSLTSEQQRGIQVMGKLQISDNATLSKGSGTCQILFDDSAIMLVEGGTTTVNQIRTVGGPIDPRGAWIHTGGTVTVNPYNNSATYPVDDPGDGANGAHALFSLPYSEMNFTMTEEDPSNPTILNIIMEDDDDDDQPKETGGDDVLIQIGVDEGNYNVTGGTVYVEMRNFTGAFDEDDGIINSTAPFWNLTLDKEDGNTRQYYMGAVNASAFTPAATLQDLIILNDFRMLDNGGAGFNRVRFDANGGDMTIGNGFYIEPNTYIETEVNTITFNGTSAVQRISVEGELVYGVASNMNGMYQMVLSGGGTKRIEGNLNPFEIGDSLVIGSGVIFDDNGFNIAVNGDIYNAGTHTGMGKIEMTGGGVVHTIDGDGTGIFANLEVDDANGVNLLNDIYVYDTLTMTTGIFDIDKHGIILATDSSGISGTGYSTTKYIRTAGNASDEGISMYIANDRDDYLFPIGTDQESGTDKYTPVTMSILGANGIDSGYVKISVADQFLPTIDPTETAKLSYFWRVNHSGFSTLPSFSLRMYYDDEDITGNENQYNGGRVLDEAPFTRTEEDANDDDRNSNELVFNGTSNNGAFPGNRFTIENANFSAAGSNAWNGLPEVYYSSVPNGNWTNWNLASTWSTVGHTSTTNTGTYPQAGDIAIIGSVYEGGGTGRHQIFTDADIDVAQLIFDSQAGAYPLDVTSLSRLRVDRTYTATLNQVSGKGELVPRISNTGTQSEGTITGDLGDFIEQDSSGFFYWIVDANTNRISIARDEFPGLRLFGNGDVDFSNPITAKIFISDNNSDLYVANDMTISGVAKFGQNGAGTLNFENVGSNVSFSCDSLIFNHASSAVSVENAGTDEHNLVVNGDLVLQSMSSMDLYNAGTTNVNLEFSGAQNNTFTNSAGITPELYRLVVNKGTDASDTIEIQTNFTLNGTTNGITKALELQNGVLQLNNNSIDIELNTGGGDFDIPSTAGLVVTDGTIRVSATGSGSGNGIQLDGFLTINGGSAILADGVSGDNYIEYGSGGSAEINLSSGTLIVGSQLRRSVLSSNGTINYNQSGGTSLFGANPTVSFENTRGVFEIADGTFTFNNDDGASTLAIVGAQANPTIGTFVVGTSSTTPTVNMASDVYIDFGYDDGTYTTPASTTFELNSYQPLSNIRVDSSNANSPTVQMVINNLTLKNDLEINNNGTFDANGLQINISGDFINDGTYTANNNLVVFEGTSQNISGTTATTFYDVTVNSSGTVSTDNVTVPSTGITITNDFLINSGTFDDQGIPTNVEGDVDVLTTYAGVGGLTMNSATTSQEITSSDREGNISKLVIDNPDGVTLTKTMGGQVVTMNIDDELALDDGVFSISDNRLFIDGDAPITTTGTFNANTMISVNGVKKSDGVEKEFNSNTSFTIPLGVPGKYTPVDVVVNSTETATLLFKVINSAHPSATGTDVLDYYWVVTTSDSDISGFSGSSIVFNYIGSDVNGNINNYANSRLETPTWTKLQPPISGNGINAANNTITWTDADLGNNNFTGEFTIGDPNEIPDDLLLYRTAAGANGNWSNTAIWEVSSDGGMTYGPASEVPRSGSVVEIRSDASVTMSAATDNNQNIFSIELEGFLNIGDSDGHNFGDIDGFGTMKLESGVLPGGNLDNFFTTSTGTVNFGGSGDYTFSADFTDIRSIIISDGGVKKIPAIVHTVGTGGIIIQDGATLSNTGKMGFSTSGPILINNGTLNAGDASTLVSANDFSLTAGTYNGNGVEATVSGDLSISGGTFNAGIGDLRLSGDVDFTSGTFNNGSGKVIFEGTSNQIVNGDFKPDKMYDVEINKSSGQVFIGNADTLAIANTLTLTAGRFNTTDSTSAAILLCDVGTGAGNYTRTNGYINGPLLVELGNGQSFTFPVGKSTLYKSFRVNNTSGQSGVQIWEVEFYKTSPVTNEAAVDNFNVEASSNVKAIVPDEYWRVNTASPANGGTFRLDASINTITQNEIDDQELKVLVWDDAGSEWDDLGGIASGTPANASIVSTIGTAFSENYFTYGSENSATALPVDLLYFKGNAEDNIVYLSWETASELNNDYFEIHRSANGVDFEVLGTVKGSGNSSTPVEYSFVDQRPYLGLSYYRLRQVDFDGKSESFEVIQVSNDFKQQGIEVATYPNPTNPENLNIRIITGDDHTSIYAKISDLLGRSYVEAEFEGSLIIDERVIPNKRMTPGIYFLIVQQGENVGKHKIVIK